jgi:acyl dehydratase
MMMIKLNRFFWGILFFVAAAAGHAGAQSADNNDAQIAALKQQLRMMDPQPFHLDEAAARRSIFGVLTASGWHTAAVTMRLLVGGELQPAGGFVGDEAVLVHVLNLVVPRRKDIR